MQDGAISILHGANVIIIQVMHGLIIMYSENLEYLLRIVYTCVCPGVKYYYYYFINLWFNNKHN